LNFESARVRQLVNVGDLLVFQTFLRLCASRTGQILNLASLASDCGISHPTARSWLSVLEASYIVFRLAPCLAIGWDGPHVETSPVRWHGPAGCTRSGRLSTAGGVTTSLRTCRGREKPAFGVPGVMRRLDPVHPAARW